MKIQSVKFNGDINSYTEQYTIGYKMVGQK